MPKTKSKKTVAKRIGLKSTLVFDDKIVISSFADSKTDKNASSNIEKSTSLDGTVKEEHLHLFKQVDVNSKSIKITSSVHNGETAEYDNPAKQILDGFDNPTKYVVGQDYIGVKSILEQKYFGNEFETDNARVQIGYNIADIKKILTLYINNITYMFYHLSGFNIQEEDDGYSEQNAENKNFDIDVIGQLPFYKHFNELSENMQDSIRALFKGLRDYYPYFDGAFKSDKDIKDKDERQKIYDYNYDVLCLLSCIRQACLHAEVKISDSEKISSDALLYRLKDNLPKHLLDRLSSIYNNFTETLQSNFTTNSANNLYILRQIYDTMDVEELGQAYFDFTVLKEQNNIGINLKQLRESIIDMYRSDLRDDEHNSYRSKLYKVIDFILWQFLVKENDKQIVNEMISNLRHCTNDEEKYKTYWHAADSVFCNCKKTLTKGIDEVKSEASLPKKDKHKFPIPVEERKALENQNEKSDNNNIANAIRKKFENLTNINEFSKLLFLMTKFLDGKEINELLCSIMNKFDSIADLTDTVNPKQKNKKFFSANYDMFKTSRTRAKDMRLIKNFARMKITDVKLNDTLISAAYALLGIENKFEQVDVRHKFILNNVVRSRRFFYVIKYTNPQKGRAIIQNKPLVELALKDLPASQIARYYKTVYEKTINVDDVKRVNNAKSELIESMMAFSTKDITSDEKAKALVGLYLTVIYLVTKNLVKVNARFAIAFSCFDRDKDLMKDTLNLGKNEHLNMLALTRHFIDSDTAAFDECNNARQALTALPEEQRKAECSKLIKTCRSKQHYRKHDYACITKHLARFVDKNTFHVITMSNEPCVNETATILYFVNSKGNYVNPLKNFRNKVAHVNIMTCFDKYIKDMGNAKSYYGVYCYILQNMLCDDDKNGWFKEYKSALSTYKTYNTDMMKLLCIPFAYNLARYKNLSTETLFNLDTSKPNEKT